VKTELFRIENLYGSYLDNMILDQVAFSIFAGEIVCLFGFNNSGKTTIVNILSGEINGTWHKNAYYCGSPIKLKTKEEARYIGIYCVSSYSKLLDNLSVAENLYITNAQWYKLMYPNYSPIYYNSLQILKDYNIDISPAEPVAHLSKAQRFLIEIVIAAHLGASLIVIDCLTAFSSPSDLDQLTKLLFMLRKSGISILYTCDTLNPDMLFSDRMIVLRNGHKVKEFTGPDYDLSRISVYATGFEHKLIKKNEKKPDGKIILELNHLHFETCNFSMDVCRGETIGIYHNNEDFLYRFAKAFGAGRFSCDKIVLNNSSVSVSGLVKWMKKKLCIIPDLSTAVCIFPNLSILENITIGIPRHGLIGKNIEEIVYNENKDLIDTAEYCSLSGSISPAINAAILVRRLQLQKVEMVMFIKPEMGLDPSSQNNVLLEITSLNKYGISVLILSNELNAISPVCSHIISI